MGRFEESLLSIIQMKDISSEVTVFVLVVEKAKNYTACLQALTQQTVHFKLEIIENVCPLSSALQEMINRCQTPYYIQVDEDMILNEDTVEIMSNAIRLTEQNTFMICYSLFDVFLNRRIAGIKIYKHDIMKNYTYDATQCASGMELFKKLQNDGYDYTNLTKIMGKHSPYWTNKLIYERFLILLEKAKIYHWGWIDELPSILLEKYRNNPTELNLFALLGAITSIVKDDLLSGEKDARKDFSEFEKLVNYFSTEKIHITKIVSKKLKILKLIDQFGWAYHFIAKEQQLYTKHQIDFIRLKDLTNINMLANYDILYVPAPTLGLDVVKRLMPACKKSFPRMKIIGAYSGEVSLMYQIKCDLIASVSLKHVSKLKSMYPNELVIYLPEGIDTNFFQPLTLNLNRFTPGWAGAIKRELKRACLFQKLNYPVKIKQDWGQEFFTADRTLDSMKDFYSSIDVLTVLSETEALPRIILEAMASGLPVVSTNVGSLELLMPHEWLISVQPADLAVQEMNQKLKILAEHPEVRVASGERNRAIVEQYWSWKIVQSWWDELFIALMSEDRTKIKELNNNFLKQFSQHTDVTSYLFK